MNYRQTLAYLFEKLPMFSRMGSAALKKDLTNIRLLCSHLGNPQQQFKSVHIGGTNGKGSVSHMLAAIFQTAGYKTGLYTSPHLHDFRERIRCNGKMVPEDFVTAFVAKTIPLIEEIQPSFFEITVAMALQYFAEQQVDIAIIEVGLGGRLDSTNIITPELSVITNIGWDHMNLLGHTLPEIAAEKAGIIKQEVPVIIGEALPETRPIFQKMATEKQALLFYAEETLPVKGYRLQPQGLLVNFSEAGRLLPVETDLSGIYQVQNLRTVLTAVRVLNKRGWKLEENKVLTALKKVKETTGLAGRWDVLQQAPTVVLEVAHNPDGIKKMLQHLQQLHYRHLHLVLGTVKDKDVASVLTLLPPSATYYFTQADIPRALAAADLQHAAAAYQLHGAIYPDVNKALAAAKTKAAEDDIIVVCGSIFLVAEVEK